jgi:hypothetical protein
MHQQLQQQQPHAQSAATAAAAAAVPPAIWLISHRTHRLISTTLWPRPWLKVGVQLGGASWLQDAESCTQAIFVCIPCLYEALDACEEVTVEPPLGDFPAAQVVLCTSGTAQPNKR